MAVNDTTRLGCGRDIDDVWGNIDHPPTAHEQSCPDCGPARRSLTELAQATSRLHTDDDADVELQASPGVITRILDIARSEVRRGQRLPLSKPLPGQISVNLTVSEQAIAAVVRRTGDATTDIQIRRCRVELVVDPEGPALDPPPTTTPPPGEGETQAMPSDVRLLLRVSVDASASIPRATEDLRQAIINAVNSEVGMNVMSVDIVVEDVHDD